MVVNLAYNQYGSGEPLVILHGLFGSAKNWHSIAKRLAGTHQVYVLDLRNHGHSPWADSMVYADLAADVERFMHQQGLSQATLLGHSMGGKTAMYLALHSPALISRLIIADIAPVTYSHNFMDYIAAMQSVDLVNIVSRQAVDSALSQAIPELSIRQFLLQNLVNEEKSFKWRINLSALSANMSTIIGFPDVTDCQFHSQTLFMAGGKSDYIQTHHEPVIKHCFPQAAIKTIENAGHWVHAEKPNEFISLINDFFR